MNDKYIINHEKCCSLTLSNKLLTLYTRLNAVFSRSKDVPKDKRLFSMDYRERGSQARCVFVYLTQDTSDMGTAMVKQKGESSTRIRVRNLGKRNVAVGRKKKNPKQGLTVRSKLQNKTLHHEPYLLMLIKLR